MSYQLPKRYQIWLSPNSPDVRKANAARVIRDLELGRDDAGHEEREAKCTGWLLDNLWAYHAIAGALHDIARRKEFRP